MVDSSAEELSLPLYVCMSERIQMISGLRILGRVYLATKTLFPVMENCGSSPARHVGLAHKTRGVH